MFHGFHSSEHLATPGSISQEDFRAMLKTVSEHKAIVGPEDFFDRVNKDGKNISESDLCILTFDDSLRSQFDVAFPVLQEFGIKAVFNVYTGVFDDDKPLLEIFAQFRSQYFSTFDQFYENFLDNLGLVGKNPDRILGDYPEDYLSLFPFYSTNERQFRYVRDQKLTYSEYEKLMLAMIATKKTSPEELATSIWMSEADLRKLVDAGHQLGLHSHTHPTQMSNLSPEMQNWEYETNLERLTEISGSRPISVAHPCGDYSQETIEVLRNLGIQHGFRSSPTPGYLNSEFELPRDDHAEVARAMGIL
jgi:peptidoglycan/xylan/chitin deacetylase (PgdA/CDA1 family)